MGDLMIVKKKLMLSVLVLGLLTMLYVIPMQAIGAKPSHALEQGDVLGWSRYDEGVVYNLNWSGCNLTMWWQIWINNETAEINASEAWASATKAICIMYITFPEDIDDDWWLAIKVWFQINVYIDIDVDEFEHDVIWEEGNRYLGCATADKNFILMAGYNDTNAPADPFTRWWAVKAPTNSSNVGQADITMMIEAIGSRFDEGPGFPIRELFVFLYPVVIVLVIIFLMVNLYKNRGK